MRVTRGVPNIYKLNAQTLQPPTATPPPTHTTNRRSIFADFADLSFFWGSRNNKG